MEEYSQYQQRLIGNFAPSEGMSFVLPNFGLDFQLKERQREKRPLEGLIIAVEALRYRRFWFRHTTTWWRFMLRAIGFAHDLEPWSQSTLCKPIRQLLTLSHYAPQPWQGRTVAYCFATFSLWLFQQGKTHLAVDKIRIATHADPTWGYAKYLLGWYGLLLEGIEPVPHFIRAIEQDSRLWQWLKQDPLVLHFPFVLTSLKEHFQKKQIDIE